MGMPEPDETLPVTLPSPEISHTFFQRRSRYAIVIPIMNEGDAILGQLQRMQAAKLKPDIILADGGSSDGSTEPERLNALGVRTLLSVRKPGLGRALQNGFAYAVQQNYEGVISVDGNGKDGVHAVPQFENLLETGYHLIQGSRFLDGSECRNTPIDRYLGIRCVIAPALSISSGFRYTDPTNGFKGISRQLLLDDRIQLFRPVLSDFNFQFFLNWKTPKLGHRVVETAVSRVYPNHGPTPTKIHGLRPRLRLLSQLFATILGRYDV